MAAAKGEDGRKLVDEAAFDIITAGEPNRLDYWRKRLAEFILQRCR